MLLRLILVGLVTSLSLELPSGRDVSSWAETGRAWANASLVSLETPEVAVVAPAAAAVASPTPDQADHEFQDVVGAMAAGFAADQAIRVDEPQVAAALEATSAPEVEAEVVADAAAALPAGEEVATVAPADFESVAVVAETTEPEADDFADQAERLATAVRLTREAAEAWAAVIAEPTQ